MIKYIVIIGGDSRFEILKESLNSKNIVTDRVLSEDFENIFAVFDKISSADIVVLPIPITQDQKHIFAPDCKNKITIEDITNHISPTAYIFGGGTLPIFNNNKRYVNMLNDETFTLKNALSTAEAALSIIIEKSDKTIFGSNITVLGYGRIAKILCKYLIDLQANVTVCARSDISRCNSEIIGCKTIDFNNLENVLKSSDIVINTVPFPVIKEKEMHCLQNNVPIIDLASKPGGVDYSAAQSLKINVIQALSLPGKYSPKSSSKYIEDLIINEITRKGVVI